MLNAVRLVDSLPVPNVDTETTCCPFYGIVSRYPLHNTPDRTTLAINETQAITVHPFDQPNDEAMQVVLVASLLTHRADYFLKLHK
jgi:hypothetical protein